DSERRNGADGAVRDRRRNDSFAKSRRTLDRCRYWNRCRRRGWRIRGETAARVLGNRRVIAESVDRSDAVREYERRSEERLPRRRIERRVDRWLVARERTSGRGANVVIRIQGKKRRRPLDR